MMTSRADSLTLHAKEIQSLILNCEDKQRVAYLPLAARDALGRARRELDHALQATINALGAEMLK